jgi:hypothetical protein
MPALNIRSEIRNCKSAGNKVRKARATISEVTCEPATKSGNPKHCRVQLSVTTNTAIQSVTIGNKVICFRNVFLFGKLIRTPMSLLHYFAGILCSVSAIPSRISLRSTVSDNFRVSRRCPKVSFKTFITRWVASF